MVAGPRIGVGLRVEPASGQLLDDIYVQSCLTRVYTCSDDGICTHCDEAEQSVDCRKMTPVRLAAEPHGGGFPRRKAIRCVSVDSRTTSDYGRGLSWSRSFQWSITQHGFNRSQVTFSLLELCLYVSFGLFCKRLLKLENKAS